MARRHIIPRLAAMKTCVLALFSTVGAPIAVSLGGCAVPGDATPPPKAPGAVDSSRADASDVVLERARASFDEARTAKGRGDLAGARVKASEAIEDLSSRDGRTDSPERTAVLSDLGSFAHDAGDLKAAEKAQRRVLEVRTRALPRDNVDLTRARQSLAATIYALGDLRGAQALFEQVLETFSRTLPEDHPEVLAARLNLASTLAGLGDLQGARALGETVLGVRTRTLPEDHPDLAKARENLAATIAALGDMQGARALFEQVLEAYSRTLPEDHPDLQRARLNLAAAIYSLGELQAARALMEQVLEVFSRTLPGDHPHLQVVRQNLAVTISALGDLAGARALEEEVLDVRTRTLPDDHPDLQRARGNLAVTIKALGDLRGARVLEEKVLEILTSTLPEDHPNLASARQHLAMTMQRLGDLQGARALQEQVLEVRTRTLPEDHLDLAAAREDLAMTMHQLGDFQGARVLKEQALEVFSRVLPEDHPNLQTAKLNLAATIRVLGDFEGARMLFEQVLEIASRTLPEDHPQLQAARRNVAVTIATRNARGSEGRGGEGQGSAGDVERCASLVHALAASCTQVARAATLSSSSREAEERCSSLGSDLSLVLSFAAGYGAFDHDPGLARDAFVLSETTRGSALTAARLASLAHADQRYDELRTEIRSASNELARLVQSGATREAYDAAVGRRDLAQREIVNLASRSPDSAGLLTGPDPLALAKRMSDGDAMVIYRRYTRWDTPEGATEESSTESLCAFVIRKEAELELVDLGPIQPIEVAVKEWRDALGVAEGRGIGATAASRAAPAAESTAAGIRALVLDPLSQGLRGAHHLVMVLDDVLQAVPIDALPAGEKDRGSAAPVPGTTSGGLLGDRYEIELRSTTQELMAGSEPLPGGPLVLLLGGADYFAEPSVHARSAAGSDATRPADAGQPRTAVVAGLLRGGAWGEGFEALPGTLAEARGLEALAVQVREEREVVRLEGDEASRESIEALARSARFLHLATHGWFAPDAVRSWSDPEANVSNSTAAIDLTSSGPGPRMSAVEWVKGSSPMLLCGLALAGANVPADAMGRCRGLVTAEEISGWDLSNCELAVLSACDTNVGERRAGQGVASLQKALHMAGARTVITSLWKVPDEATKELMLDFYRRVWIGREPKSQALWNAKKHLREAKDERGEIRYSTRDWAAWVLTGDPS